MEALLIERAIQRVLATYCRAVDRHDEKLLWTCFHDDAHADYGTFRGPVAEVVPKILRLMGHYTMTFHFLGNTLIDVATDRRVAVAETYAIAHHQQEGGPPRNNMIVGCRYVDRFERRDPGGDLAEGWRVADRRVITDWVRIDNEADRLPIASTVRSGRRDGQDAVYDALTRMTQG